MKSLFTCLALAGLLVPLAAHANPAPLTAVPTRNHSRQHVTVIVHPRRERQTTYLITDNYVTGSHIPVLIRQYGDRREVVTGGFGPDRIYGAGALAATGSDDIATALRRLDPSFR